MPRRLFTIASALALLLLLALVGLWVWGMVDQDGADRLLDASPVAIDFLSVHPGGVLRRPGHVIRKGELVTVVLYDLPGPGTTAGYTRRVSEQGTLSLPFVPPLAAEGRTVVQLSAEAADAYFQARIFTQANLDVRVSDERPRVPAWSLAVAFATPPAVWALLTLLQSRRRRLRERDGRCVACGYDLRATSGRCPECGTERSRREPAVPPRGADATV